MDNYESFPKGTIGYEMTFVEKSLPLRLRRIQQANEVKSLASEKDRGLDIGATLQLDDFIGDFPLDIEPHQDLFLTEFGFPRSGEWGSCIRRKLM